MAPLRQIYAALAAFRRPKRRIAEDARPARRAVGPRPRRAIRIVDTSRAPY